MLQESAAHAAADEGSVWLRPWRVLLLALGAVFVASLLLAYDNDSPVVTPLRLLLMLAALIAGGWAVKQRLTTAGDELDERVESAGLIAVYSLCGLIGFMGMAEPWFSGRIFFAFFITFTILGSLLALLPRLWRAPAVTVLALLHFGGIVVASTVLPATNGQSAWLPSVLYLKVYRPYLTGLYFTNAYHFYAPDPGSSTIVWIRVEYADGSFRWLKFPNRPGSETPLHYQRLMGMCESTSARAAMMPDPERFEAMRTRRFQAGIFKGVPMRRDLMPQAQYYPPNDYAKAILSSMARHASRYYPNPDHPEMPVKGVKIYRLSYTIIMPPALLQGGDPLADNLKLPFFAGDYDTEGNLVRYDLDGQPLPPDKAADGYDDPFLNWAIPMEYLPVHAGDKQPDQP